MPENIFLNTLQQITERGAQLGEVINGAQALSEAGQDGLAKQLYKIWIGFNPTHPQLFVAHFNISALHTKLNETEEAIEALKRSIALDPEFLPAYINLGGALEKVGQVAEGVEIWREVVRKLSAATGTAVSHKITALKQIARVTSEKSLPELAEPALQECLTLDPHDREVMEQYMSMRLNQCKWPVVEGWDGMSTEALTGGIHPLSLNAYTDDPLLQLASAARYVEQIVKEGPELLAHDRRNAPIDLSNRRLRVGYVSSDLRDHAVGYLLAEMLELHDRSKVEVFAYYCGIPATGDLNARIRKAVEHWVDIREMSDDAASARIAADGIDILVDVNGHTRDARSAVFARRPAPIIVNWLGFPGTMGTPYHHYIVADPWVIPPGAEIYYSEAVKRLPCYQSNDRKRTIAAERPTRAQAGLPETGFVFCCFNAHHKINRFTFARWMEILKRTPDSVLWLLEGNPSSNAHLVEHAKSYGVAPERLVFAPKLMNAMHLARYPLADLFLDCSPYGAHTTASDALFMGVPMLTFSGRCFASRVCSSLVRSAGLEDMVCETPAEYVEKAIALAADPVAITALKARLEANRSSCTLFDMDLLTSSLEGLYFEMVDEYLRGELPQPDLTNLDAYLKIGLTLPHEVEELTVRPDYNDIYKSRLEIRHRLRPLQADTRLWTAEDLARLDGKPAAAKPAGKRAKAA